jgi:hypothetical protein
VLLCRRHHRSVHEDGFHVERLANGELEFRRPDGRLIPEAPATPNVPANADATLRAQNAAVHVDAQTLRPSWGGERLNVAYAIDVLYPPAPSSRL